MITQDSKLERIKESAIKVFYEKGFYGTRVIEIANQAQVSKSILNYYFRSKEHLFKIVVDESIDLVVKKMNSILTKDLCFYELMDQFIYNILVLWEENKKLLLFIITEYNQNYDKLKTSLKPLIEFFNVFKAKIQTQSKLENITIKNTKQLLVNIISLYGWHMVGVNLFSIENSFQTELESINISDRKKQILEKIFPL
ncbi:MAG TPA: TetR/AcrR family transcriptional regulator [Bacteroidales bacterium]|nr:TetR/AcrR family transcriptional regulator [Bacteroidales bacterium]